MVTRRTLSAEVIGENDEGGKDTVEVEIVYHKDARVRGYYLRVSRSTLTERAGYSTQAFALFGGIPSRLLEAAPRFNAKRLATLTPDPAVVDEMRAALLAKA